jgi:acyl transferase domain-containing protein
VPLTIPDCRPNGKAQQDLLLSALRDAHLQPGDVSLLETHGTGTKLGDPVEMAALSAVFSARPSVDRPLYLTAVKANVGHLEAGAGMAGLFSILLALQHRTAPPNALLKTLNEDVRGAIGDASMVPITSCTPLEANGARRLVAGVSSFGYSGTIAHVLLQEAPEGVRRRAMSVASDSAATCGTTLVHSDTSEPAPATVPDDAGQSVVVSNDESEGEDSGDAHDQVWQFSGQGDMRVGAGKELWDTEETFRAAMIECDTIVRPMLGKAISELLYPPGFVAAKPNPASTAAVVKSAAVLAAEALLAQTVYSQAALVALEYCLAAVWLAQGVQPDIVLGHSLGKFVKSALLCTSLVRLFIR